MCYQCGQKGHYAKSCPQKRLSPAPRHAEQQGRTAQPRAPRQGKVNHVMAESAAESPNVVIGTSLVSSYPATVLFDTGATHSFITQSFVEHHGIRTSTLKRCKLVSSPRGQLRSHIICPRVSVSIGGGKVQGKSDGDRHQGY